VPCVASDAAVRPEGTVVFRTGNATDLAEKIALALEQGAPQVVSPDAGPRMLELYCAAHDIQTRRSAPQVEVSTG
jgi:glycogen synthase